MPEQDQGAEDLVSSQNRPQQMGYTTKQGLKHSPTPWASLRHPWDFQEPLAAHGGELGFL